jgi:hypothetical protein
VGKSGGISPVKKKVTLRLKGMIVVMYICYENSEVLIRPTATILPALRNRSRNIKSRVKDCSLSIILMVLLVGITRNNCSIAE